MKDIKAGKPIILPEWDLEVIPYLMVNEIDLIIENMLNTNSVLEQQQSLVASVLVCVTDLFDGDTNYTYEDVVYSGLWDDILNNCPYLKDNIDTIWVEVERQQNLECKLGGMVDSITDMIIKLADDKTIGNKVRNFVASMAGQTQGAKDGDSNE